MTYDSEKHHRKSIRLKKYDYSLEGYYFVTICTHKLQIFFDSDDIKETIENVWNDLPKKFSGIELDEFIVMPNHIHGIIIVGASLVGALTLGNVVGAFKSFVSNVYIDGVKNKNWKPFNRKLLQRNYYEHVIRTEKSLEKIRRYIVSNPYKWEEDIENPKFWKSDLKKSDIKKYYDSIFDTSARAPTRGAPTPRFNTPK